MDFVFGSLHVLLDALAILLLFATWQNTRIAGFLMLAGSYALGVAIRWGMPVLLRVMDAAQGETIAVAYQTAYLATTLLALAGLWDIYRRLKRPAAPPAP